MATGVRQVFAAPELFAEPAHAEWTDPVTGVVHAAELGGVQFLVRSLMEHFGGNQQDISWQSLVAFFEHQRGTMSMEDYLSLQEMAFADAQELSRLELGPVGRSYFMLRGANLTERQDFDVRLRVNGDLTQYENLRELLQRMYSDPQRLQSSTAPALAQQFFGRESVDGDSWNESSAHPSTWWSDDLWNNDYDYDNGDEDVWYDNDYDYDDND